MDAELDDLAESFRTAMRAANRAQRTQELRLMIIRYFREWLIKNGRPTTRAELTHENIQGWLADLNDRLKPSTVGNYFAGLQAFCNWLVAEDELSSSPMAKLERPIPPEEPVPILDDTELAALIKACSGKSFECRRDEAFIRFINDAGTRTMEACGLERPNLDIRNESALIHGKGGKIRPVYFGARTALSFDRYMRERAKHKHARLDAVFLGQRGAFRGPGARHMIRRRARQAGIEDRMFPHRFRHTWAHDFLLAGGQERDLKRLAGWSSDAMLSIYGASAADWRAREAARRLRRGDRL